VSEFVKEVAYEDLCRRVSASQLLTADEDALADFADSDPREVLVPVDLAGLVPDADWRGNRHSAVADSWWSTPFERLPAYAALLRDALCVGGRVHGIGQGVHSGGHLLLAQGRFVVPDSYHARDRNRTLADCLVPVADGSEPTWELALDVSAVNRRDGLVYFGGAFYGHFGHFMTEGLSRLWLLSELGDPDVPIAIYDDRKLHPFHWATLQLLGIPRERIIQVTRPTVFRRLLVPSRTLILHRAIGERHHRLWRRIADAIDSFGEHERVYVSRSRFTDRRALVNEDEVEAVFADRGFLVFHPQEHGLEEQIAIAKGARWLAGSAGSGMYLSAFQPPDSHKLILSPRRFTFRDDQLISHFLTREPVHYFLSDDHATGPPRLADYRIDQVALRQAVDIWIDSGNSPRPASVDQLA
jgi:hypothetical protein